MSLNLVYRPAEFWRVRGVTCARLRACGWWLSLEELKEELPEAADEALWLRPGDPCSARCPWCGSRTRYFECEDAVYRLPVGIAVGLGKDNLPEFTVVENLYSEECRREKRPYLLVYNCASRRPTAEWDVSPAVESREQERMLAAMSRDWYYEVLKPHVAGIPVSISLGAAGYTSGSKARWSSSRPCLSSGAAADF